MSIANLTLISRNESQKSILVPSYFALGASLYTPCTHSKLEEIMVNGIDPVRSMVFCLEDAIRDDEVGYCLKKIELILPALQQRGFLRFIRPRNPHILNSLMNIEGVENIDGFVLPKVDEVNIEAYLSSLTSKSIQCIMPTIETDIAFDDRRLEALRKKLDKHKNRVLCLRIGGNDLLNLLSLKRSPGCTIYETPLKTVIDKIMLAFKPYGYNISAPVFDIYEDQETLKREMEQDKIYGFFAKTAIHPTQVKVIHDAYKVSPGDIEMAKRVVNDRSPAVFKLNGQMVEPTTHYNWAVHTLSRMENYGIQ